MTAIETNVSEGIIVAVVRSIEDGAPHEKHEVEEDWREDGNAIGGLLQYNELGVDLVHARRLV